MFSTDQLEEAQQWQEKGRGGVRFCHKINQWQPHSQQGEPLKQIFGKILEIYQFGFSQLYLVLFPKRFDIIVFAKSGMRFQIILGSVAKTCSGMPTACFSVGTSQLWSASCWHEQFSIVSSLYWVFNFFGSIWPFSHIEIPFKQWHWRLIFTIINCIISSKYICKKCNLKLLDFWDLLNVTGRVLSDARKGSSVSRLHLILLQLFCSQKTFTL